MIQNHLHMILTIIYKKDLQKECDHEQSSEISDVGDEPNFDTELHDDISEYAY